MANDMRRLTRALEDAGYVVDRTRRGHIRVRTATGRVVAIGSGTPSDHRSWANFIAQLRRDGFTWPR